VRAWKSKTSITQQFTIIILAELSLLFQKEHSRQYGI
jgi:hypothetical protein